MARTWDPPADWSLAELGELLKPSKERIDPAEIEDVLYVGLEHIEPETGRLIGHGYSDEVRSMKTVFRAGNLLYGKLRPYLNKVCIPTFDGVCSTDILALASSSDMLTEFLLYRLLSTDFVQYADLHSSGVQHPRVHYQDIAKFQVVVPSLFEQRRIVNAIEAQFSRLDVAVATLERAQGNLQRYKAAVLQAACEGRLVPTEAQLARQEGRDYEPADVLLERILAERRRKWEEERWAYLVERAKKKAAQAERKAAGLPYYLRELPEDSWVDRTEEEYAPYLPKSDKWKEKYEEPKPPDTEDLPELPEGWVWATVAQVGEVMGGLTKNRSRSRYPQRMPYLRVANVYADELRLDDLEEIGVKESELDRVLLQKGDLLVVEGNGSIDQIGRVAIWNGSVDPCVHQNHVIKVRFVLPAIGRYVLSWLLSVGGREQIIGVASSTSGLYTLSLSKVSMLPVPFPPLREQMHIVEEADHLLSITDAARFQIDRNQLRADCLRQSILKCAFEGRLMPQDPSEEPAQAPSVDFDDGEGEDSLVQDRLPGM